MNIYKQYTETRLIGTYIGIITFIDIDLRDLTEHRRLLDRSYYDRALTNHKMDRTQAPP